MGEGLQKEGVVTQEEESKAVESGWSGDAKGWKPIVQKGRNRCGGRGMAGGRSGDTKRKEANITEGGRRSVCMWWGGGMAGGRSGNAKGRRPIGKKK